MLFLEKYVTNQYNSNLSYRMDTYCKMLLIILYGMLYFHFCFYNIEQ
jgi:hypothetical protein